MNLEPVGDRVILQRLKVQSSLVTDAYTHFAKVVAKSSVNDMLQVGDVVVEPESWIQVPDREDLIVAKTKHIVARVKE